MSKHVGSTYVSSTLLSNLYQTLIYLTTSRGSYFLNPIYISIAYTIYMNSFSLKKREKETK